MTGWLTAGNVELPFSINATKTTQFREFEISITMNIPRSASECGVNFTTRGAQLGGRDAADTDSRDVANPKFHQATDGPRPCCVLCKASGHPRPVARRTTRAARGYASRARPRDQCRAGWRGVGPTGAMRGLSEPAILPCPPKVGHASAPDRAAIASSTNATSGLRPDAAMRPFESRSISKAILTEHVTSPRSSWEA